MRDKMKSNCVAVESVGELPDLKTIDDKKQNIITFDDMICENAKEQKNR